MNLFAVAESLDDDRIKTVDVAHFVIVLAADVVAEFRVIGRESIVFHRGLGRQLFPCSGVWAKVSNAILVIKLAKEL
mgnify:CR=1 FL=1